jgi:hypothetical protein
LAVHKYRIRQPNQPIRAHTQVVQLRRNSLEVAVMSTMKLSLDLQSGRYPGSFADHVDYNHGPRGALGRYMLAAEAQLDKIGVTLKRVEPMDMVLLNRGSQSSWWRQVPVLDAEDFPPTADELVCWIGFDKSGKAVTAYSMRLLDLGGATLKDEMESLRFFYGARAVEMQSAIEFQITAPFASEAQRQIVYTGGFWVHPSMRGSGLSAVVPKISFHAAIASWGAPVVLTIVRNVFLRPDVSQIYEFENAEPYFSFKTNGRMTWEGSLVWMTRPYLEGKVEQDTACILDGLSTVDGRSEQTLRPVDVRRLQQP